MSDDAFHWQIQIHPASGIRRTFDEANYQKGKFTMRLTDQVSREPWSQMVTEIRPKDAVLILVSELHHRGIIDSNIQTRVDGAIKSVQFHEFDTEQLAKNHPFRVRIEPCGIPGFVTVIAEWLYPNDPPGPEYDHCLPIVAINRVISFLYRSHWINKETLDETSEKLKVLHENIYAGDTSPYSSRIRDWNYSERSFQSPHIR